jgi:REase_AHJR-like
MTVDFQLAEKGLDTKVLEQNRLQEITEKYRLQGFEVVIEPSKSLLPFDMGNYCPDLIARKGADESYIIELKNSIAKISVDRYREIAEIVAQHNGWRFLLITGEDVSSDPQDDNELLTWEQMLQRQEQAQRFLAIGEVEVAFFYLWGVLEAAMRRQAKQVSIPIERFPANSLINHLYSQGELSMEQFDQARVIQTVRDRSIHGYQLPNLEEPTKQLQALVNELIVMWML